MKKITLFLILCLTFATWSHGQCTTQTYQFPTATVNIAAIPGPQTIATNNWPQNEYSVIAGLVVGESYTVTIGGGFYVTVAEGPTEAGPGTTVIGHAVSSVSFVATTTVIYCYWTADALCGNGPSTNTLTQIECTTCTCAALMAPGAATGPTPADMAIDIPIDLTGATPLITPFSWVEDMTGDPATSFDLSIGTDTAATSIGTISSATNGNGITFDGWATGTTYYWKITAINCFGSTESAIWSFTTSACTATAGPDVATTPTPGDAAIDIPIDDTDPMSLLITPFSWVDAGTGEPATSYNLTLGITPAGDDIGTITGFASGGGANYTWAYNTTYYWRADAVNCFGTTPGTVWSFTTEADPGLSIDEFETKSFSIYPNPAEDIISIDANVDINTIEIYNQLGQRVIQLNETQITNNTVNVSELNKGIYFIEVASEDRKQAIKFIKK